MRNHIHIALAKGRLAKETVEIFRAAGLPVDVLDFKSRKLVFTDEESEISYILVKPADVPTYVHHGVADIGVAGKDTLMEENLPLYEMLDLGLAKCKLSVAGFPDRKPKGNRHIRVATKYPAIARQFYESRGENIETIKLNGSVELGPLVGLSDVIVDIVESGSTLKANGLVVLEDICDISARLVVNQVSLKTKHARIHDIIERVGKQIGRGDAGCAL